MFTNNIFDLTEQKLEEYCKKKKKNKKTTVFFGCCCNTPSFFFLHLLNLLLEIYEYISLFNYNYIKTVFGFFFCSFVLNNNHY